MLSSTRPFLEMLVAMEKVIHSLAMQQCRHLDVLVSSVTYFTQYHHQYHHHSQTPPQFLIQGFKKKKKPYYSCHLGDLIALLFWSAHPPAVQLFGFLAFHANLARVWGGPDHLFVDYFEAEATQVLLMGDLLLAGFAAKSFIWNVDYS